MNRFTSLLAVAFVVAGAATSAQAVTVNFEELTGNNAYDSPLISGGLVFTNSGDGADGEAFYAIAPGSNGTITVAPNYFGSTTSVTAQGGTFTLTSFDFSDAFDFADDPVTVTFTFNLAAGGTTTRSYTADAFEGMQTALVGLSGISSFSFVTSGSLLDEDTVQTDNWVYSLDAAPGVPEPATWAMLIGGFGMTGGVMRRRAVSGLAYAA